MGRLVQGWPLIHVRELSARQEKGFALVLVSWPSCRCCNWAKGDLGSPARLALTQATGESASGCWVIAVMGAFLSYCRHFHIVCGEKAAWASYGQAGGVAWGLPVLFLVVRTTAGKAHLLNPSRCTVAAGFWALSSLPASFLGPHLIQIKSLTFLLSFLPGRNFWHSCPRVLESMEDP